MYCTHGHLLPLTPQGESLGPLQGSPPALYWHLCVSSLLRGNRAEFHVHYTSFWEARPATRPHLACRDSRLEAAPGCGVPGVRLHLAWQQRLLRVSH